jgi:putative transposase
VYGLVHELADDGIDVAVACRVLKVSRSGYYDWRGRPASAREQENTLLMKLIEEIHADEDMKTYGAPRVHAELVLGHHLQVNHKRVARLMRQAGIQGLYRRRRSWTTIRDPKATPAKDLVNRQFTVDGPNRLWLTDITEHPTVEGKVYCAAVMDAWSRRILGWSIDDNMRKELVVDALGMAVLRRNPVEVDNNTIMHSDHGSQFTSWAFSQKVYDAGLVPSMGSVGDCYDNAMMESFWERMQLELLDSQAWFTRKELANAMFRWIESWYNRRRRHSSIGMLSPIEFETRSTRSDPLD